MNILSAGKRGKLSLFLSLVIASLAGLLVFYHAYTLYDLYLGGDRAALSGYDHIQSLLRMAIVTSLILVVLGKRIALWAMWLSIGGLVATHYWAHFLDLPVEFTADRHPLSYLRGFIIPTIITLAFNFLNSRADKPKS